MESVPGKLPNPVKSEHLIKGIKPIMVCLYSYGDLDLVEKVSDTNKPIEEVEGEEIEGAHNVNFFASAKQLERQNFLNSKKHSYIISPVDNLDKFSNDFIDCTGIIVVGVDKITGENISFLTHQNPYKFLREDKNSFLENLGKSLTEIKDRCKPGTIDAVFVGGKYPTGSYWQAPILQKEYLTAVELISGEVKKKLGFEPVVVNGPKAIEGEDSVYFDNSQRRVYLSRPEVNIDINSFTQSGPRGENL